MATREWTSNRQTRVWNSTRTVGTSWTSVTRAGVADATVHNNLSGRDATDAHPAEAISYQAVPEDWSWAEAPPVTAGAALGLLAQRPAGGGDSLWEQIDDPGDPGDGMIRPVESATGVALDDRQLYYRQPGDLNHSLGWGYVRHGVDGPVVNGFDEIGFATGDANANADELHALVDSDGLRAGPAGQLARVLTAADKGTADGVAELDGSGLILLSQLPSFVDDVVEYANVAAFPVTGESGIIYVALDSLRTYRWSGSVYVEISASLALGETSDTAYRGDRGKTAYDHSQITTGNPHGTTAADVGAEPAGVVSDVPQSTFIGAPIAPFTGTTATVATAPGTLLLSPVAHSWTGVARFWWDITATSATSGQTLHLVVYSPGTGGRPGSLLWSQAFDAATVQQATTTTPASVIPNRGWWGVLFPSTLAGNVTMRFGYPAATTASNFHVGFGNCACSFAATSQGSTPASSISSYTFGATPAATVLGDFHALRPVCPLIFLRGS